MKRHIKCLIVLIMIAFILNIKIPKSFANAMTGYQEGKVIIEIELLNSNGNNNLAVYTNSYIYENRYKKPFSTYINYAKLTDFEISNNIYKYTQIINLLAYPTPLIVIKDNNGNERTYYASIPDNEGSYETYSENLEIVASRDIPIYIQINCEDGTFKNLTDIQKIKKYKQINDVKDTMKKIFPISIIILLFIIMLIVVKRRRKKADVKK